MLSHTFLFRNSFRIRGHVDEPAIHKEASINSNVNFESCKLEKASDLFGVARLQLKLM